jgi:hypothetical protein
MGRTWSDAPTVYPFERPTAEVLATIAELADALVQAFDWGRRD